jgi:hypothetical protein
MGKSQVQIIPLETSQATPKIKDENDEKYGINPNYNNNEKVFFGTAAGFNSGRDPNNNNNFASELNNADYEFNIYNQGGTF